MSKQGRGIFFLLMGIVFLAFVFSRRGQDMWAILIGSSLAAPGTAYYQNGVEKYKDPTGYPLSRLSDGTYLQPYDKIPGTNLRWIPSVRDMPGGASNGK